VALVDEGRLWEYAAQLGVGGFFICLAVWFAVTLVLGVVYMVKALIG